jgi:hypothetical protein
MNITIEKEMFDAETDNATEMQRAGGRCPTVSRDMWNERRGSKMPSTPFGQ